MLFVLPGLFLNVLHATLGEYLQAITAYALVQQQIVVAFVRIPLVTPVIVVCVVKRAPVEKFVLAVLVSAPLEPLIVVVDASTLVMI